VTGAFISLDRAWFETLGGFTENYVFGHYEDADLCLKSIQKGTPPWIHDIRMWHLEGKGSTRLPVHEGGSLVNRWLFTNTWREFIAGGLYGSEPASPMFHDPGPQGVIPRAMALTVIDPPVAAEPRAAPPPVVASRPKPRSHGKHAS
jgi:hypothetical protein